MDILPDPVYTKLAGSFHEQAHTALGMKEYFQHKGDIKKIEELNGRAKLLTKLEAVLKECPEALELYLDICLEGDDKPDLRNMSWK